MTIRTAIILGLAILVAAVFTPSTAAGPPVPALFQLLSPSFTEGQLIPVRHTCDGPDVSPALQWNAVPDGTASFALICDDPDAPAGTWVHWVIFNIPPTTQGLAENLTPVRQLPDGSRQGLNDFQKIGYNGPCPPPGPAHRYFFKLYALSTMLDLPAGSTKAEVMKRMEGKILATAQLMGRYKRQR